MDNEVGEEHDPNKLETARGMTYGFIFSVLFWAGGAAVGWALTSLLHVYVLHRM